MQKRKSHKGAAKRFGVTASGKIKYNSSPHRHILTKKSPKRKRNLRAGGLLKPMDAKKVKKLLPYL